jgi:hypothetical protein
MNTQTGADVLALTRIRANLAAFRGDVRNGRLPARRAAIYAGMFSTNCDELIELVERLTRPPLVETGTGWPAEQAGQS